MAIVDAICWRYGLTPTAFLDRPMGDIVMDFAVYQAGLQADAVHGQQMAKNAFPVLNIGRR